MNILAKESIVISAPLKTTFSFVINLVNFSDWFPEVISITEVDNTSPNVAGKIYKEMVNIPIKGEREVTIRVKSITLNKQIVTEGNLSPLLPRMIITFTQHSELTTVSWQMESRNHSALFRYIMLPFAKKIISKRAKTGLIQLKRLLEDKN